MLCLTHKISDRLDQRDEVRRIIGLVLEPLIDHLLLLDVLELSEPMEQAGPLFLVVDPARLIDGAAIAANLRLRLSPFSATAVQQKRWAMRCQLRK